MKAQKQSHLAKSAVVYRQLFEDMTEDVISVFRRYWEALEMCAVAKTDAERRKAGGILKAQWEHIIVQLGLYETHVSCLNEENDDFSKNLGLIALTKFKDELDSSATDAVIMARLNDYVLCAYQMLNGQSVSLPEVDLSRLKGTFNDRSVQQQLQAYVRASRQVHSRMKEVEHNAQRFDKEQTKKVRREREQKNVRRTFDTSKDVAMKTREELAKGKTFDSSTTETTATTTTTSTSTSTSTTATTNEYNPVIGNENFVGGETENGDEKNEQKDDYVDIGQVMALLKQHYMTLRNLQSLESVSGRDRGIARERNNDLIKKLQTLGERL